MRRPLTGNRAFWALAGLAALVRAAVMLSACCAVAVLAARVDERGVSGLGDGHPSALPTTVVVTLLTVGAAAAAVATVRAVHATAAFRHRVRTIRVPAPGALRTAAATAGLAGRVSAVADQRPFALTHGLLRPRVLVSTGLIAELTAAELDALLAHERAHVTSRDPLKAVVARVLSDRHFCLPLLRGLADSFADGRELAADRRAVAACGTRAVAGALLKAVDGPRWAAAPAAAMGSARLLHARIDQVETGAEPPLLRTGRLRPALSLAGAAVLVWALAGTADLLMGTSALHCWPGG